MAIPYERYSDQIQVADHDRSGSESDIEDEDRHERRIHPTRNLLENRWPKQNGILQLVTGFIIIILGKKLVCFS